MEMGKLDTDDVGNEVKAEATVEVGITRFWVVASYYCNNYHPSYLNDKYLNFLH